MYYEESEARRLVIEAGRRLLEKKLTARTWGNISARTGVDEFVITPSGKGYETLEPEDLVTVRVSDCSWEGNNKPSSEKGVHAAAYALRDNVNFVIHTHQPYASAIAAECRSVSFAPCSEYALPGTSWLRKNVEACIKDHPEYDTFLMARHGALILAGDMDTAFSRAEELENYSRRLVEKRVPSHDTFIRDRIDTDAVKCSVFPCVTVVRDQYIMECCQAGVKIGAYIDDFAQIVGPDMICVDNDPRIVQRALLGYNTGNPGTALMKMPMTGALHQMGGVHPALNSVIGRGAVLVKGVGAVCAGATQEDADAAAMIVSKNCMAACYVRNEKPLGAVDARLQRIVYLTSYSGLKDK